MVSFFGLKLKMKRKRKLLSIDKEKLSAEIEKFDGFGLNKSENRTEKVIVSLTSFPQRMHDIHYGIYSLLTQTYKPDEIILWLTEEEFPNKEKDVPPHVLKMKDHGLSIKWCHNIRSYNKLIPTIKEHPDAIIVTADDDIFYRKNWLKIVVESYRKNPHLIHCHRAHGIRFKNNEILPYNKWKNSLKKSSPSYLNFLTGVGGVLYPPNSLHKDITDEETFTKLAPNADDIWFWAMALRNKTRINLVKNNHRKLIYINPDRELGLNDETTLGKSNIIQCKNDTQMKNVIEHYPEIMEILKNEKR